MDHFAVGKVFLAVFFALFLVLVFLSWGQKAATLEKPKPVIIQMEGGGAVEVEGALQKK